jgi:hypothetical protein
MSDNKGITTGVAEISVDKLIALEKGVAEKDQTIGALKEQIKTLNEKIEEVKADCAAKQAMVLIQTGGIGSYSTTRKYNPCTDLYDTVSQGCTGTSTKKEYKNLDTVIEDIRKEEAKKINIDFADLDKQINALELEKLRLNNQLDKKNAEAAEELKQAKLANKKQVEDLRLELQKVQEDKTDVAIEEARKQEIIDLKERITELEKQQIPEIPNFGWFKTRVYNWLNVDGRAKVQAERENLEKKERIEKISNNYPKNKSWWRSESGIFNDFDWFGW